MSPLAPVILGRLRNVFDTDANPRVIDAHLKIDPLLRRRVRAHPGLRVPGAWDAFELGLRAVLGQQVSVVGATTLSGRLAERFGDRIHTPWKDVRYLSPTAVTLTATDIVAIADIGVPKARAAAIRDLATFAAQGGFHFSGEGNLDDAVERLKQVRGIGDWTAQYIAMRALRFRDAFPAADLGLRKAVSRDTPVSAGELLRRAECWRPWRAYAAAHLWQSPS
jgi:AraC family transcriptional regulator of adaptative response / DNA-3-methyladenine glycosylase II